MANNWLSRQADPHLGGESFGYDGATAAGVPAPTLVTEDELNARLAALVAGPTLAQAFGYSLIAGKM